MNFMFSAKELDKETGFYYYGARYLDPKYSRWISADPAMNTGEYFPQAPVNDEAKKHNQNLPGMGGVFNHINGNLYHYAANNPVKYTDPDGRFDYEDFFSSFAQLFKNKKDFKEKFAEYYFVPYDPENINFDDGEYVTMDYDGTLYTAKKTEYGKLSTYEKLCVLVDEYRKLAEQYEANKTDGVDALERLKYGIFEFWFSANSYSNTDEFFINFFGNNLEATADMAQFDLDEINLWLQMKIINKEIERLKKVYENE